MRKNRLLEKLRTGQPAFGCWLCVGSPILAEEVARAGFDWALLDGQHGYWCQEATLHACQIVEPTGTELVTRVPANDAAGIGAALDMGALSVVVPMVNSAEEARRAVAAMRYPPDGIRSAGGSRLLLNGPDYWDRANREVMAIIMIETREAAERADEILSVPGVDACLIGSGDLAISMGMFGRETAEHEALIQKVLAAGRKHGVYMGYPSGTVADARKRAAQGFQLLTCGSDIGAFWDGLKRTVQDLGASRNP